MNRVLVLLLLLLLMLLPFYNTEFVLCRFQPHGQLLHERKEVVHGDGCGRILCCKGGAGAGPDLFQRQAGGFVGPEAGPGFEVEGAVAAFVVSRDLIRDCDGFGFGFGFGVMVFRHLRCGWLMCVCVVWWVAGCSIFK